MLNHVYLSKITDEFTCLNLSGGLNRRSMYKLFLVLLQVQNLDIQKLIRFPRYFLSFNSFESSKALAVSLSNSRTGRNLIIHTRQVKVYLAREYILKHFNNAKKNCCHAILSQR